MYLEQKQPQKYLEQKQSPEVFFIKKVFLKILQNWEENTLRHSLFLIKLEASTYILIKK